MSSFGGSVIPIKWGGADIPTNLPPHREIPHGDVETVPTLKKRTDAKDPFQAQINGMINEQEAGMPTAEVCRRHGLSTATFYKLVGVDPKTVRRERPPDCGEFRKEMQEIAGKRRRIGVLLERKGMIMNHKKLYRTYREEGLSVKRRGAGNGRVGPGCRCWPLDNPMSAGHWASCPTASAPRRSSGSWWLSMTAPVNAYASSRTPACQGLVSVGN